jgi:hypothetical protein
MMLFKRQRLTQVFFKQNKGYFATSLQAAFSDLFLKVKGANFNSCKVLVGKSQDIETIFASKLWLRSLVQVCGIWSGFFRKIFGFNWFFQE